MDTGKAGAEKPRVCGNRTVGTGERKGRSMEQYKAYVFDMDGTVLNTLTDLCTALNYAMGKAGHKHDYEERLVGLFFGSAVRVATTRALAVEMGCAEEDLEQVGTDHDSITPMIDGEEVDRILKIYKPFYQIHCDDETRPYEGIPELVRALGERGCRTAVVSNKPDDAVQKLNRDHFEGVFDYAIGESAAYARKPEPDMVLKALEVLGVSPEEAVYIGDTEIDLETARRCGMDCICVTWGFRTREFLAAHGAARIVDHPLEILPGS